jgi:cytochrome P450
MTRKILQSSDIKIPPTLGCFELFKLLPQFRRDSLKTFLNLTDRYGHIVCFKGLVTTYLLITHPKEVEHVLQTNQQIYYKSRIYAEGKSSIGNGLLINDGDFWRQQRRLAQPAFHRRRIGEFAKIMTDSTEAMLVEWQNFEQNGQAFNVVSEMKRLTLRVAGLTLFSTELDNNMTVISRSLEIARAHFTRLMWHPIRTQVNIPTKKRREYLQSVRDIDEVIYQIINEHRQKGESNQNNLLSMLIQAQDEETGESMSDRQLRDEMLTIFIAGHETTAVALSWTWYLLARHKDVAIKLYDELSRVLNGRTPTFEDLPKLKYTLMIIEEGLRLYPPIWIIGRRAIADDEIGGYKIKAGSEIIISPYITQRHSDFWENPEKFNPERFPPREPFARPRFAYFPFGGGARSCIGDNFALMEMQLIIATIAQKYRLCLSTDGMIEPSGSITLHPRKEIMMHLQKL